MHAKNSSTPAPDRPDLWHLVQEANSGVQDSADKLGLALISLDFEVLDANDVHLERWHDLIGTTCFEHCNHFPEPCVWCPVKPTFSDGGVHLALAASPKEDSQELEYSHIISFPAHRDEGGQVDVALEVLFNLTSRQKEMVDLSNNLHSFLKGLSLVLSRSSETTLAANLLLFATVSKKGLGLDEATVLQISLNGGALEHADYARTLNASAIDEKTESEILSLDSPEDLEGELDALLTTEVPHPKIADFLNVTAKQLAVLIESEFPRRIDARTTALCIKSAASPVCLLLIAKSLKKNALLLDYELNDAALLQALFSHGFNAARVGVPIGEALQKLRKLLKDLDRGAENVVFAAPVAFGLAHDLTPALNTVAKQVMCLEAEVGARNIDRQSLRQILDNLKRAERRFKVCRSRLQSIARLFTETRKRRERCYLNSLIDEVHDWLSPDFEDHAVDFDFRSHSRIKNDLMHADRVQVFQILYNLITNALKALQSARKQGRRITVRTFQPEDERLIGVSVTDTAGSLVAEARPYIYEPFFSTDSEGIGLGLWIVKTIIDRLGATLEVSGRPSVSTTFRVLLPRER